MPSKPQQQSNPQQQTTLQKVKTWLCNAGNSLVASSDKLGSAGFGIEAGGLALAGMGIVGQPEVNPAADVLVGAGVATMRIGAAAGTIASVMQVGGGIAQMIGSNDSSVGAQNAWGGSASLTAGAQAGWASGLSSEMTQALVGMGVDTGVNIIPGMNSGQAQCGN
jgi:hypothetical protein